MSPFDKKCTRRKFLVHGATLLTGLGLSSGLPPLTLAGKSSSIQVAVLAPSHCALPIIYADLAGFYHEHGLRVDVIYAKSMSEIAQAIADEQVHFGQMIVPLTLVAQMGIGPFAGQPQQLVSPMWAGTNGGAMVVRNDSGIKLPQDLKGKTIGIHNPYLFHWLITMELLKRHNLTAQRDVTIKTVDLNNMVTALEKGDIDAFINAEPVSSAVVAKGVGLDFILTKDLWFRHPCCCLTAKKSLFEREQHLFRDFVSATMRSALTLNDAASRQEKVQEVWENIPQYQQLPLPVILNAFTPGRADFDPFPYQSSVKIVGRLMQRYGLIPQDLPYEKIVSEVFLAEYGRNILREIDPAHTPLSNDRQESIIGRSYS